MITIEYKNKISWCTNCKIPIITDTTKALCSLCGKVTRYMCADIRPVFPEERLLTEILLEKPFAFADCSVWASSRGRYYVDGQSLIVPQTLYQYKTSKAVKAKIDQYSSQNTYDHFNNDIANFTKSNKKHLAYIKHEATEFIRESAKDFLHDRIVISFSGGKDSTVCADLVYKALGNPSLVHIFGDTTLEFDLTYEYVNRFRAKNPLAIIKTTRNNTKNFFEVCRDIGTPARRIRWCCTMFKTGPISKTIHRMFGNNTVITFNGIRANESSIRSTYERIESQSENRKIQQQISAKPIFYWSESDVWLYILSENLDFNDAYRLGCKRVGCWVCPNNNLRSTFLNQVYIPDQAECWRNQLIEFAKSLGKSDYENYVDDLYWTRRFGGKGIKASADVQVENIICATDEHARVYNLKRPVDQSFYSLFNPFGLVQQGVGRKLIGETLILDPKTGVPIISIQPFKRDEFTNAVKIKTLNVTKHKLLQSKIVYQIRKFNACRECGKCAGVCIFGAITLDGSCSVDENKCRRCQKCVSTKYIEGGCMMMRTLHTKGGGTI